MDGMIAELERGRGDTPAQARFREIVRAALHEGRCPGPTELNARMGWNGGNNIHRAWAVKIRTAELEAHGWSKDSRDRWVRTA